MVHHSWNLVCVKSHKLSILFSIFQVFKLPYLHTINSLNIMVSHFLSSKSTNPQIWIVSIDSISKWPFFNLKSNFLHLSFLVVVNFPLWWWNHHISMEVSWVDLTFNIQIESWKLLGILLPKQLSFFRIVICISLLLAHDFFKVLWRQWPYSCINWTLMLVCSFKVSFVFSPHKNVFRQTKSWCNDTLVLGFNYLNLTLNLSKNKLVNILSSLVLFFKMIVLT
jgi:hypothetical protein